MNNLINQWKDIAEFIGFVETADLDAMGVPTGTLRSDLANFRTAMNELIAFFNGTSTSQTVVPSDVVDKIRSM